MGRDIREVTQESHRYPFPLQYTASSHGALTTWKLLKLSLIGILGVGAHHVQRSINTISNASMLSERWYTGSL